MKKFDFINTFVYVIAPPGADAKGGTKQSMRLRRSLVVRRGVRLGELAMTIGKLFASSSYIKK